MAKEFKNLREKVYYIKSKKTKLGKTTYFMTTKKDASCLEEVPAEYEVFEKYDSQMLFIRKKKPNKFTLREVNTIRKELEKNEGISDFQLDFNGAELKIYTAEDKGGIDGIFGGGITAALFGNPRKLASLKKMTRRYEERMRIKIVEKNGQREEVLIYRYCYRGSVDDWIIIDAGEDLITLAKTYLFHIGRESYFELPRRR